MPYISITILPLGHWGPRLGARALASPSEPSRLARRSPVAPTGLFERPSRPKSARTCFFDRFFRPKWLAKGSKERFWSILGRFWLARGSILVYFQWFSARACRLARRRFEKEATYEKPVKTTGFSKCFSHIRACAHDAKIDKKSIRTRFSTESRDRSPSKAAFFELRGVKMSLESSTGSLGRPPGAPLGVLGKLFGQSWGALRRSWGALGAVLGALGRSWALLGRSWNASGGPLEHPERSGLDFGSPG